jgi:MFS family permease
VLVLAISQGPEWGWTDPRTVGAAAVAVLTTGWFVARSARHPDPVVDPALFGDRAFVIANLATFVYSMGFFAMLLGNILFLTHVWGWSIMWAGLAVTPGPIVVAVVAGPAGHLAGRIGFRPLLLAGSACFAAGLFCYVAFVDLTPDHLRDWLPGTLITGLGIGLTFPVLSAAAVSTLPPDRYAVGSAVNQTARQVGGAIGVAVLVVLLGTPTSLDAALEASDRVWLFVATAALLSGAIGAFVPRPAPRPVHAVLLD